MTEPATATPPDGDVEALIARQSAALERHRAGDTAEQIADRLAAYGYAAMPPGYARAVIKADIAAAVAREDGHINGTGPLLQQVIQARFGDRFIVRVPADSSMEQMHQVQQMLTQFNPGARFAILACDPAVLSETEIIDQAANAVVDSWHGDDDALLPLTRSERLTVMRAAATAMLTWLTTPATEGEKEERTGG